MPVEGGRGVGGIELDPFRGLPPQIVVERIVVGLEQSFEPLRIGLAGLGAPELDAGEIGDRIEP